MDPNGNPVTRTNQTFVSRRCFYEFTNISIENFRVEYVNNENYLLQGVHTQFYTLHLIVNVQY